MRSLLLLALLLAAGTNAGARAQSAAEIARLASEGRAQPAAEALVQALRRVEAGGARGRLLDGVWAAFRGAGASGALLGALDLAASEHPDDVVLAYYRGTLRADLKLHEGARRDFERVVDADPGQRWQLARLAARAFRHAQAAELSQGLGGDWIAFHRHEQRLADALEAGARRQWGLLAALVLGFSGLGWWLGRRPARG